MTCIVPASSSSALVPQQRLAAPCAGRLCNALNTRMNIQTQPKHVPVTDTAAPDVDHNPLAYQAVRLVLYTAAWVPRMAQSARMHTRSTDAVAPSMS
jgi:hypothetical protein